MRARVRLTGAGVWDASSGSFRTADVVVEGDRIAAVVAPDSPTDGATIALDGAFLLPGLIDCHVHLTMRGEDAHPGAAAARSDEDIAASAADAAERTVMAGVTAARDLGGWNHVEMEVRAAIERGERPGPRLLLAGRLLSIPTPAVDYYPGMYEVATGPEEVRAAARRQIERGADVIKVMATGAILSPEGEDARAPQFSVGELRAAVDAAEEAGIPVAAHAHAVEGIRNAVEAGVSSIEHGTYADRAVLDRMADRGVYLVATMSAGMHGMDDEAIVAALPAHIRRRFEEADDEHLRAMRAAHAAGVPFAMGTDAGAPGDHHGRNGRELVALVEKVGLSPVEAIDAATVHAARLLRREADLGVIAPGAQADLVAVRADPLGDIAELTRVAFVMKAGRIVRDDRSA